MNKKATLAEIESASKLKLERIKQLRYIFEVIMTRKWPEGSRVVVDNSSKSFDLAHEPTDKQLVQHINALIVELSNIKKQIKS